MEKVTENQPETLEQRALLFWEFFEVVMQCCREIVNMNGVPLHESIPCLVQTARCVMDLVDNGDASLPDPPAVGSTGSDDEADFEGS